MTSQSSNASSESSVLVSYPNLERVTFTGADDSVKAEELLSVSRKYPHTEWGILFGASPAGSTRFPSLKWLLSELPKLKGLNLCAHLCGQYVFDLAIKGRFTWREVFHERVGDTYIDDLFKRVQINFHGIQVEAHPNFYNELIKEPYQFIFQDDVVNRGIWKTALSKGVNAVRLFDVSHGAGVLPGMGWPQREGNEYMGYAGGLGPANITSQLAAIDKAAGNNGPYWIDMETRVRSHFDKQFDLTKVTDVLKQIYG